MGSGTTPWEIRLAELLRSAVPSLERLQITNTGSEATAHAIRLSRAWTGRDHLLVMIGGYNGWHNDVARAVMPSLETLGPRVSPGEYRFSPLSAGIPETVTEKVHIVNFNDIASVEYVLRRHPIACVLTEPVLQNIGVRVAGELCHIFFQQDWVTRNMFINMVFILLIMHLALKVVGENWG